MKNKALTEISMVKERKKDVTQFSGLIGRTTSTRREGKENRYPRSSKDEYSTGHQQSS